MTYTVEFCGPSKDFFLMSKMQLTTDRAMYPHELKALLLTKISLDVERSEAEAMLNASLIGSNEKILGHDALLPKHVPLFLLPPVCGG